MTFTVNADTDPSSSRFMFNTYRNLARLLTIIRILTHHGLGPLLVTHLPPFRLLCWARSLNPFRNRSKEGLLLGVRLRQALEALGPTFIKFGQTLSTRTELLPEDIGQEMKKLQDAVPPFPFETVKKTVEEALSAPLETLFQYFNPEPVASASIAQVHEAVTQKGRKVAVKVIRPNIRKIVDSDIRALCALAQIIEDHVPQWRRFRAKRVVQEFSETIRSEMNFLVEAARAQTLRKNFENDPVLHVPEVIWSLTKQHVLTLEWVSGIPIDELPGKAVSLGIDVDEVSKNAVTIFFKQVFRDGYFHADQHPGNVFVQSDGSISVVDFGIVGHVSFQTRIWLAEILVAFLMRNYRKVAQTHLDAGYVAFDTDIDEFEEACRQIGEPVFGQPLKKISIAALLAKMFQVTEQFQMEVQPQLLLLQKTMLTLEGIGRELNPDLNIWQVAEPLIQEWMITNLGPQGRLRTAREDLKELAHIVEALPKLLHSGARKLAENQVQVRLHPDALSGLERRLTVSGRRVSLAIFSGALFIGSAILALAGVSPWWYLPPLLLSIVQFVFETLRTVR